MAQNFSRNDLIKLYLDRGYRARDIDKALQQAGMGSYNPLTTPENWQQLPGRFLEQGKALGRDLTTLGGEFVNVAASNLKDGNIRDKFIKAVNSEPLRRTVAGIGLGAAAGSVLPGIGTLGGGILGGTAAILGGDKGLVQGGRNLVDAVLSTYGTNLDEVSRKDVNWKDVAQGVMDNPLYAGLDLLSVGGAKTLGKAGKSLASKTGMTQKVLPGTEVAELNRRLTNNKLWAAQSASDTYAGYNKLQEMPLASRSNIANYLVSNIDNLSDEERLLANQIKTDLKQSSKQMEDMGLFSKEYNRNNTIAQYVMNDVRQDTNLLHKDIMDLLTGKKLRPIAANILKDSEISNRVNELIKEGKSLYKNGDITFLSQKLASTTDPLGNVIARWENLANETRPEYARVIGRATPEQLGNVLDDTLKIQLDRSAGIKAAIDNFSDIINNDRLGISLSNKDKPKYINAFRKSLKRDIMQDRLPNFEEALKNSGIDTAIKNASKPIMYESLKGFFRKPGGSVVERFSNKFKKNVLGIPSWSVGNRLGNWSMNAVEGVEAIDYADVGKYKKLIPDALKLQSSYNSYLGLGNEVLTPGATGKLLNIIKGGFVPKSFNKALTEFKKSYGRYKNSDKTISDKVKYMFDLIGDIGNVTASPIFELEANMEYMDRAANYIRQAKRLAEETGESVENILKESRTNRDLFFDLNSKVNKSLGDYYGRNYAMPGVAQDILRQWIPFYRFPVQTMRVTAHNLANTPIGFASNISVPARAGNVLSNQYISQYGLDRDKYTGGVPYVGSDNSIRTLGLTPAPLGIVAPRLADPTNISGMLNPLFSGNLLDILEYKKFDKTPSSPRYTAMKATRPMKAINYKPTPSERTMFALNEILGTTYNPYIWGTRIAPQAISLAKGEGRTPFYNTMQPIKYKVDSNGKKVYEFETRYKTINSPIKTQLQNVEGYKKTTPLELLGSQLGISTRGAYQSRPSKQQTREIKSLVRKTMRNIEKNR